MVPTAYTARDHRLNQRRACGRTTSRPCCRSGATAIRPYSSVLDYNPLRPDLGPGRRPADVGGRPGTSATVGQYTSYAQTWYRALLVAVTARHAGSQLAASYTWSSAEDNASDYIGGPQDNGGGRNPADPAGLPLGFDPMADRGPAIHDIRHRLVISGQVRLPGEFQVSGIARIESGRPYDLLAGTDFNRDGAATDRPRRDPTASPVDHSSSVRRHAGRMPGSATLDLRVQRHLLRRGDLRLDAMIEAFNVLNRTNYIEVNRVFGPGAYPHQPLPTFGQFTAAAAPRQGQLALRLVF